MASINTKLENNNKTENKTVSVLKRFIYNHPLYTVPLERTAGELPRAVKAHSVCGTSFALNCDDSRATLPRNPGATRIPQGKQM